MPSVRQHPPAARRSRAFSLIELLVSISIIAILIGILIPVLPRVFDSAHRTACQANERSIAQALTMHLNDKKDVFPEARYMPPPWLSGDPNPPLNEVLAQYFEGADSRVWECPGDSDVFGYEYESEGKPHTCPSSYTYNTRIAGHTIEDTPDVRWLGFQPSQVVVIRDYDGGEFETQSGDKIVVDFFHNERNFLFADGHVGSIQ
jgi:prepilin-type N-terminal cleavage/methylation domain-containing protein/prepilin-type processing-associated H-X9-DG protein